MKRININGEEAVNQKVFDKKVNVEKPLYFDLTKLSTDLSPLISKGESLNVLQAFGEKFDGENNLMVGNWSAGLLFGGFNTRGIFEVAPYSHTFRVHGTDNNSSWQEDVAWKSDIQELKQEIFDLKKQIGGVLRRGKFLMRSTFLRNEVLA